MTLRRLGSILHHGLGHCGLLGASVGTPVNLGGRVVIIARLSLLLGGFRIILLREHVVDTKHGRVQVFRGDAVLLIGLHVQNGGQVVSKRL